MQDVRATLDEILKKANSSPFLFVGSGFSRRYIGLEDWSGLLKRFCAGIKPFEFYLSESNENLAQAAQLIAEDFHALVWSNDEYAEFREKYKDRLRNKTSALRISISNYLLSVSKSGLSNQQYIDEIELLKNMNIDGIITTNWDTFVQELFFDYKVYIGQDELLFSNPQSIGEIYKIHGCSTKPHSLVLTDDDYSYFESKNSYLASKLITIFVEHPVVFVGYSLSDPNVNNLLRSIVACLGKDNLQKLGSNLIFVNWIRDETADSISETVMSIDGFQLPITIVRAKSFSSIYAALNNVRRKIPARVLRYCKEQFYELVTSGAPTEKLYVTDIDGIENSQDIEFVMGVGVKSDYLSKMGYTGICREDIFKDLVFDDCNYVSVEILKKTLPELIHGKVWVPFFKYLNDYGVSSKEKYEACDVKINRDLPGFGSYTTKSYAKKFVKEAKNLNLKQILEVYQPAQAVVLIPFLKMEDIDLELLLDFLRANYNLIDDKYATYYKKLVCFYDQLKYGWDNSI